MRVLFGLLLLVCLSGAAAQTTVNPDANNIFLVSNGVFTGYTIQGILNPTLNMTVGKTYFISIQFDSVAHPFGLNTNKDSTAVMDMGLVNNQSSCTVAQNSNFAFTATAAKICVLAFTPTAATPQPLWYHCNVHPDMKGQIQVNPAAAAATTPPPTNTTATTAPPTAPPTTPPKGGASGVVPGAVAVVLAAMAAMAHLN